MKRTWKYLIGALLLCLFCLMGKGVEAFAEEDGFCSAPNAYVADHAELFSEEELEEITEWILEKEEESGISIRIVTDRMRMRKEKIYLENCFDFLYDEAGTIREDAVFMLINMDTEERGVCLQGYGECEFYFNNDRIEHVLDDLIPYLKNQKYVSAAKLFATEAAYYRQEEKGVTHEYLPGQDYGETYAGPSNYYKDRSLERILMTFPWGIWILGSAGFAGIAVAIMVAQSGGKVTVSGKDYMNKNCSGIVAKQDEFLRETVKKVYSPQSSGSSGGGRSSGGGGRSSGGHSHSGGSRRF